MIRSLEQNISDFTQGGCEPTARQKIARCGAIRILRMVFSTGSDGCVFAAAQVSSLTPKGQGETDGCPEFSERRHRVRTGRSNGPAFKVRLKAASV